MTWEFFTDDWEQFAKFAGEAESGRLTISASVAHLTECVCTIFRFSPNMERTQSITYIPEKGGDLVG